MAQPAVNDVLTWDGAKGVYAPNPALSLALTDSYIFVGNSIGVATGVPLTLNDEPGPFALGNTGILTMPDASATGRGLLNAASWSTVGFLHNDGAGNLEWQAVSGAQDLAATLAIGNTTGGFAITSDDAGTELRVWDSNKGYFINTIGAVGITDEVFVNPNKIILSTTGIELLHSNGGVFIGYDDGTISGYSGYSSTQAHLTYYNSTNSGGVSITDPTTQMDHTIRLDLQAPTVIVTCTDFGFSYTNPDRVLITDPGTGFVVVSVVTSTELSYVSGATSNLQAQINALVTGLSWKQAVRVRTTANITLSGTQTIDGIAVIANDRVLVMNQTDPKENGIYVCAAGAWSRSTDADTGSELLSATVATQEGTLYADQQYVCTTDAPIVIGVSNIVFILVGGTTYIGTTNRTTVTGNVIDISASYVGQTSITTLGTITTGTLSTGAVIAGVTMTLGSDASYDMYYRSATGVLTRLANGTTGQILTATTSNAPSWAAPATNGTVTTVSVVTNQGVSGSVATATTTPAITLTLGALTGVTSFNGLVITANTGVITTGTWNASLVTGTYGGTGINNGSSTITIGGNVIHSGAFSTTMTVTATTSITLPDSGTLYGTKTGSITSAQLIGSLTDPTGTGVAVFGTAPTFTTSIISPIVYGSSAISGALTIRSTSNATLGNTTYNAAAHIFQTSSSTKWTMGGAGQLTSSFSASASVLFSIISCTAQANTGVTASSEMIDIKWDLSATKQWATGAITTQRDFYIAARTYSFVGASTVTTAATFAISGAPIVGTNATITNAHALWVQSGQSHFDGNIEIGDAFNFILQTTTGTKIGTATSQKLSFWNATPIVQPTTAVTGSTMTANSGTAVNDASTWDGYTIGQIVKALRNIGALA